MSSADSITAGSGHEELRRLQWLRDFSIAAMLLAVLLAHPLFHTHVPWPPLLAGLALWTLISILTWRRLRKSREVTSHELLLHISLDILLLSLLLAVSGGPANPLTALYLPTLALAAAVLPARSAWSMALASILAYSLLWLFSPHLEVANVEHAMHMHLAGMWLGFAASALLIAAFVGRSTRALRLREQQLSRVREQALRDERIVALGNLAAGAAHELGTPLATMAVITGELQHDASLPAELRTDIELLGSQIQACKTIISRLAAEAGARRAADGPPLPLHEWLQQLVARWQALRPHIQVQLDLPERITPDTPCMHGDANLEQALLNLFNNAADASPQAVDISASWDQTHLDLQIRDRGPGFLPQQLAQAGQHAFSSRPEGLGIGLLLSHSTLEHLGAEIRIQARSDGPGSLVQVHLPLTTLLAWHDQESQTHAG